ncbi:tyrosine-type recombinase/integrase [Clostridium hydrogeniformans]|uniref:tyrosine-type recombinase/integrase n=1 Tax=Clostridium hydrogeniformans TaxID=349933 RepID=UPI000488E695|nr:site-specific integrase [Clostridium hydrogeniformans]
MATKTNYEKNGQKYYRVTASIGRDSSGKLIRKEFYGKSKKEAELKRDEYIDGIKNGLNSNFKDVTLGKLIYTWLFEVVRVSSNIKPSTFERYEGIYRNYIKDSEIYSLKLNNLKSINLQRYYNNLYSIGKSSNVIKNLNKLLKTFFNYAVNEGYMIKNLCAGKNIVIPGESTVIKEEIIPFTDDEIKSIKKALEKNRLKALILLDLGTGLRRGELLALKWRNVDINNCELVVKETLKRVTIINEDGSRTVETLTHAPKTKHSYRSVPIPSNLIPILKEQQRIQKLDKLKSGDSYISNDYVFTTEIGNHIDERNLTRSYKRILEKADVKYRKFHNLRHTYATKLFQRNVPLKTVQVLLGHSDINLTANIYTHVIPKEKSNAVDKLNDLFM